MGLPDTNSTIRIGVDIGGTFTDFVAIHPDAREILTLKLPSNPVNPEKPVLSGISKLQEMFSEGGLDKDRPLIIIHGSTVATNALLERKGAPTALITTKGFRDVLQIGRQNRRRLYDLLDSPRLPLIPEELRFEIKERVDSSGRIITPLEINDLDKILSDLKHTNVSSIAVCLLFSFLYPEHECEIGRQLRSAGYFVSLSSEISPEYREYERMSTTAINAYVSPTLDRYLQALEESITEDNLYARLRVMQSNGGQIGLKEARRAGVRCILSGPAGGVIGSKILSSQVMDGTGRMIPLAERESPPEMSIKVITFDMGGTSTDVSLIDQSPLVTTEAEIGGFPIQIPMLDIHTIGAGGGSIAYIDPGLALRVGPESAGAEPGPACYGRGDTGEIRPTVTDANLVLGRIPADFFLGGEIALDYQAAAVAIQPLGEKLGLDIFDVSLGIIDVVNAHMERALRVISVERGYDPEQFTLVSFGGAGGLHAAELARQLGISRILVSPLASTLSAFGMIAADAVRDYSRTVMFPGAIQSSLLSEAFRPLLEAGQADLKQEAISSNNHFLEPALDMRYQGQSYELTIPYSGDYMHAFHQAHARQYGYSRLDASTEIVTIRVRATGRVSLPLQGELPIADSDPSPTILDHRPVYLTSQAQILPFYLGDKLSPGNRILGPAVVVRSDTTILLLPGDIAQVDPYQNLIISVKNDR